MGIMENTLEREIQQKIQAFRDVMLHHCGKVSLYSKKTECLQFEGSSSPSQMVIV
jgi:hypothetical protein